MRVLWSSHGLCEVLTTDEQGKEARYAIQSTTTGRAWIVRKIDPETGSTLASYLTSPARGTCTCEGRGHGYQCRHLDMLNALLAREAI